MIFLNQNSTKIDPITKREFSTGYYAKKEMTGPTLDFSYIKGEGEYNVMFAPKMKIGDTKELDEDSVMYLMASEALKDMFSKFTDCKKITLNILGGYLTFEKPKEGEKENIQETMESYIVRNANIFGKNVRDIDFSQMYR